jgi:hypothetical protein
MVYSIRQQYGIHAMSLLKTFVAAVCLAGLAPAQAETLLLDDMDTARGAAQSGPARGMSMERVEAQFGTPVNRVAAVGEPPITRWEYPDFTVYFEYKFVIHAVRRR